MEIIYIHFVNSIKKKDCACIIIGFMNGIKSNVYLQNYLKPY